MSRRSSIVGLAAAALLTGGCTSGGSPDGAAANGPTANGPHPSVSASRSKPLCETIGTEALRKASPTFEPDSPGQGSAEACVRLSGGLLRILITDASTDAECAEFQQDRRDGITWIGPDQLAGIGDVACGQVITGANQGVLVTVLSRRDDIHVSVALGRTPGDVNAVQNAVKELAMTVMQRV
jgi:hypothetical protein